MKRIPAQRSIVTVRLILRQRRCNEALPGYSVAYLRRPALQADERKIAALDTSTTSVELLTAITGVAGKENAWSFATPEPPS